MDPLFFIVAIVIIALLIAIRATVRQRGSGLYVEVFQTSSRTMSIPESLTKRLAGENIRYRIVYKGPANQPFIGMSGEQFVSIQAHVEDLERARRIVSKLLHEARRATR